MARLAQWALPVAGLLVAAFSSGVVVRAWLGERSFAEGRAAQRRGDLNAADAAYRASLERGNADAAIERARLELVRGDWAGAGESLRKAMALAPARGFSHVLQAELDAARPGPWDVAREEQILSACRRAVALEPYRAETRGDCAGIALSLAARRRDSWDPSRTRAVLAEAGDGYAAALALNPKAARHLFGRMLAVGGEPVFLVDVAFRRGDADSLSALVGLLLDRSRWAQIEPHLWATAGSRGVLPAFAATAADALTARGMIREGLAAAHRGLLAAPGDAALALRAADITSRLPGREALAAAPLYRGVVAADPGNLAARRRFATFLAARELFTEAEHELRAVVGADPKDAGAWFLLGETLRRSGRAAEAAAAYRAAAGLSPKNPAYRRAASGG